MNAQSLPTTQALDITVKRGDSAIWDLIFASKYGTGLVGATVRMYIKNSKTDADSAAVLKLDSGGLGGISITDAGNGVARITITPAQLSAFAAYISPLLYDIQVTESNGVVTTLFEGSFAISTDVTQTF